MQIHKEGGKQTRRLTSILKITLLALFPLLTMVSCKDQGVEFETATISGTITIENANLWETWKDSGDVILSLFPEFLLALPPTGKGWGEVPDDFFGAGVPGGRFALGGPSYSFELTPTIGVTQYHYTMTVPFGTYSALALGFRHDLITDPSLRTATLGVHWNNPNEVSHGIVLKISTPGGIVTLFNEPAPSIITLNAGDDVTINFKADFAFVNEWY